MSTTTEQPVAVIMSVYCKDDPQLFDRALRSISEQTYSDGPVRLYLCIDGPIDEELEGVIRQHLPTIHKLTRNTANKGIAAALNALIDALEDEQFVFRMDSDDYSHPDRIVTQVLKMRKDERLGILGTWINEVDTNGRHLKTVRYPTDPKSIPSYISIRSPVAHPSVCFRRCTLDRLGHYPNEPPAEDLAMWFKSLELGIQISNIDSPLLDMTITDNFYKRRNARRAWREFQTSLRGVRRLHGVSFRLGYPFLRLAFRMLPTALIKLAYRSSYR